MKRELLIFLKGCTVRALYIFLTQVPREALVRPRCPWGASLVLCICFFVFQVFVASPHKTQPIVEILLKNQPKLIEFLSGFQKERTDDEQFTDEKNYLIKQIRDLKKTAP